jgi:DNA polymerase-1
MTKKDSKKRLVLLDSHAIIHRAYHALPDFSTSKGEPTGALYGISTMLMKIMTDLKPDYIVATYDLPGKTFRHEAYDAYKGKREKIDDALVSQLISSRRIFEAFGIPMYDHPGFEADDMLGTIVEMESKNKDLEIVIASGDMDTLQLVKGKKVQVFTLKKGLNDTILYDEEKVNERFGFGPEYLPDYKGLRGDPSDNIIGVPGIGEKTATTLITAFGTIENIYKTIKKSPEKLKELKITDRIIELLKTHEDEAMFSKTLATIRRDAPINFVLPEKEFGENVEIERIESLFRELEFKSLISRVKSVLEKTSGIEVSEKEVTVPSMDRDEFEKLSIALWLLRSDDTKITEEDITFFDHAKTLDEAKERIFSRIKTDGLEYVYNQIELPIIKPVHEMQVRGIKIDTQYLSKLSTDYHKTLESLEQKIWKEAGHEFNINSPKQLGIVIYDELAIQPNEGKKMAKTASGARSTRESELEKMRDAHPIIGHIFEHRELQKLLSTYIDTIPHLVDATDGRLHAKFNQAGTTTGRFSSENPNMQNLPIKSELGKAIRSAFVSEKGSELVSFDYSQIELRIAALLAQDKFLLKVFQEGKDPHGAVASKVFHVPLEEVTHEMRRRAKVINFGILYGMGVNALRQNLNTDRKEAQEFYDNYFIEFPSIKGYLESVKALAYEKGYTETLFGRRRYFPMLKSRMPFERAMAERMVINAPIQGTATADIIKLAISKVDEMINQKGMNKSVGLLMQIHDELVYEVKDEMIESFVEEATKVMENIIPQEFVKDLVPVPLKVGVGIGENYGLLK